jgi:hypothetical protein
LTGAFVRLGECVSVTRANPGIGKTMLAVGLGLGRRAAGAGHRTYFTNTADLAARCHRATIEGRRATTMPFYAGPACR